MFVALILSLSDTLIAFVTYFCEYIRSAFQHPTPHTELKSCRLVKITATYLFHQWTEHEGEKVREPMHRDATVTSWSEDRVCDGEAAKIDIYLYTTHCIELSWK